MKNRFMFGIFILTIMIIFNSCANDDQATVTINLIRNDMAFNNKEIKNKYSIIDKFISFIFMSTDLNAKWNDDHTAAYSTLSLSITGDEMSNITAQIPGGTTSYTIQVPSGANRKIIFTNNTTYPSGTVPKNWGGSTIVNLAPGDSVKLTINMIPMTVLGASGSAGTVNLSWQNMADATPFPSSVTSINLIKIYRSDKPEGPYTFLKTAAFSGTTQDLGLTTGKTYYYKASIMSTLGEGVQCDYASATP